MLSRSRHRRPAPVHRHRPRPTHAPNMPVIPNGNAQPGGGYAGGLGRARDRLRAARSRAADRRGADAVRRPRRGHRRRPRPGPRPDDRRLGRAADHGAGPGRGDADCRGAGRGDRGDLRPGERPVRAGDRAAGPAAASRGPGDRAAGQPCRRPRGPRGRGGGPRCGGPVRPVGGRGLPGRGRPGAVAVGNAVPRRPHHRAARGDAARAVRGARSRGGGPADRRRARLPGPGHAGPRGRLGVLGGEDPAALPAGPSPAGRALRWLRDLAVSFARAADRRMAIALGALLAVLVTATLVLHFTYRLAGPGHRISLLESVYFTVETVTTVGYGDYTFRGEPAWLIVFAIGLMITGALFVAVFFALVTNMLVSRRIEESLGLQKIVALRGHVLVIGLGTIGLRVVRKLHDAGREVAVIEKDEHNRHLSQVRALGVPVMISDATLPEVLASARLAAASAVAVLTSDDLANLETGLAVRDQLGSRWREVPVVLRIFDPQLAHSVKETFGFRNVRSTAALAAPWFVGAALGLDVLSTFYAGDEPLLVARLTVPPGGGLHGLQMHELAARTRVLALRRAADRAVLEHPPRRATRFEPADEAYLIGPYDELLTVRRRDRPSAGEPPTDGGMAD